MDVAKLVLNYVQALIWPALVVFAAVRFGPALWGLLQRVSSGGQLQVGGPGFNVLLDFRETVRQIAAETEDPAIRESARRAEERLNDELLTLASSFYETPIDERRRAAAAMRKQTEKLTLDELLALARSEDPGNRVAAGIGLGERLKRSQKSREDPRVTAALRTLINDRAHSRVRYRAAEALYGAPELIPQFEAELRRLAAHDSNSSVRAVAQRRLKQLG
jgi:hypothetical protein